MTRVSRETVDNSRETVDRVSRDSVGKVEISRETVERQERDRRETGERQ